MRAFFSPPPVSSSSVSSREISMCMPKLSFAFEVIDHVVGEVMHVDNDFMMPKLRRRASMISSNVRPADFDQRFGTIVGQRPQSRTQARRQDHRSHSARPPTRDGQHHIDPLPGRRCFANCLRQVHRAMLPAGTTERHHQVLEAAVLIIVDAAIHQRLACDRYSCTLACCFQIFDYRRVLAGQSLEPFLAPGFGNPRASKTNPPPFRCCPAVRRDGKRS